MMTRQLTLMLLWGLLASVIVFLPVGAEERVRDWSAYPMDPGPSVDTWESLEQYECHTWGLRITGQRLRDFKPGEFVYAVEPDIEGNLVLNADEATIHGSTPRVEKKPNVAKSNIGDLDSGRTERTGRQQECE